MKTISSIFSNNQFIGEKINNIISFPQTPLINGRIFDLACIISGIAIMLFFPTIGSIVVAAGMIKLIGRCALSKQNPQLLLGSWSRVFEKSPELKKWFEKEFCNQRINLGYRIEPGNIPPLNEKQILQAKQFYEALSTIPSRTGFERPDSSNIWIEVNSIKGIPFNRLDDGALDAILALFWDEKNSDALLTSCRFYNSICEGNATTIYPEKLFTKICKDGKLFMPVIRGEGVGAHVTLIVANFKTSIIQHFDSLGSSGSTAMVNVGRFLNRYLQTKGMKELKWDMKEIKHHSRQDLDDCTIFVTFFAESLLKGAAQQNVDESYEFNFKAENGPYYRLNLLYQVSENYTKLSFSEDQDKTAL